MQKNEYIEAKCIDYTHDGMGIVRYEGMPIFVKNMLSLIENASEDEKEELAAALRLGLKAFDSEVSYSED